MRSLFRFGVIVTLLLFFVGCDPGKQVKTALSDTITEIQNTRKEIKAQSESWQTLLKDMENDLHSDVQTVIDKNLTDLVRNSGVELRCNLDFVDKRLLAYLDGLESALQGKLDELRDGGSVPKGSPDSIVAKIIEAQGRIQPYVCSASPSIVEFSFESREASEENVDLYSPRSEFVTLNGFALQGEGAYSLSINSRTRSSDLRVRPDTISVQNYLLMIRTSDMLELLDPSTDRELVLSWSPPNSSDRIRIVELPLVFGDRIRPPKKVYITKMEKIQRMVHGTDFAERAVVTIEILDRNGKAVFAKSFGAGEKWDKSASPLTIAGSEDVEFVPNTEISDEAKLSVRITLGDSEGKSNDAPMSFRGAIVKSDGTKLFWATPVHHFDVTAGDNDGPVGEWTIFGE